MKTLTLAAMISFVFCSACCRAETAEEIVSSCRALSEAKVKGDDVILPEDFDSGVCWGTFAMVQQMITVERIQNGVHVPLFPVCAPVESTRTQLIQIFEQYAARHPECLHERFWPVVQSSLQGAFPCSR